MALKSTPNNPRLKPPRETIQKNKCPQVLRFSGSQDPNLVPMPLNRMILPIIFPRSTRPLWPPGTLRNLRSDLPRTLPGWTCRGPGLIRCVHFLGSIVGPILAAAAAVRGRRCPDSHQSTEKQTMKNGHHIPWNTGWSIDVNRYSNNRTFVNNRQQTR